nr:hypothetical protein [Bacillota bacterium]
MGSDEFLLHNIATLAGKRNSVEQIMIGKRGNQKNQFLRQESERKQKSESGTSMLTLSLFSFVKLH